MPVKLICEQDAHTPLCFVIHYTPILQTYCSERMNTAGFNSCDESNKEQIGREKKYQSRKVETSDGGTEAHRGTVYMSE